MIGHLRYALISCTKMVIFCCFPPAFKLTENILDVLGTKKVHIDSLISNFVIDAINK